MNDAQFFKALALIQLNDVSALLRRLAQLDPLQIMGGLQEAAAILVSQGDIGAANASLKSTGSSR